MTGLTCEDLIVQDLNELSSSEGHVKLEILDGKTGEQIAFQTVNQKCMRMM